ncbi:hypothetical protein FRB90_004901 [Tulasnella sp. 427]|nr:hypothetical protein FRB90_004901 [Tulasnella sp. 427]
MPDAADEDLEEVMHYHPRYEEFKLKMTSNTPSNNNSTTNEVKDTWSAKLYNKNASFVYSPAFTSAVLSLLNAKAGERILDLGCGSGEITVDLQTVVGDDGLVVGTDFSHDMIEKSQSNGLRHAFVADAQALEFPPDLQHHNGTFDAVFTNAALHWCKRDPAGVIRSVKAALKKDGKGRFAGEFGGYLNCVGLRGAIHSVLRKRGYDPKKLDPWYFPSVQDYQSLLESEGFEVQHISLTPRITPLPGDLVDWQQTFCRESCFAEMSDQEAAEAMSEVQDLCAVDCRDASGSWAIMYVRLRFVAILSEKV